MEGVAEAGYWDAPYWAGLSQGTSGRKQAPGGVHHTAVVVDDDEEVLAGPGGWGGVFMWYVVGIGNWRGRKRWVKGPTWTRGVVEGWDGIAFVG